MPDVLLCRQEHWPFIWYAERPEAGLHGADPLTESLTHIYHYTKAKRRTKLLLPALILEQFGRYMRYASTCT